MLFYGSKMFVAFRREFNIKSSFLAAAEEEEKTREWERKKYVDKLFCVCVWERVCVWLTVLNEAGKLRLPTLLDYNGQTHSVSTMSPSIFFSSSVCLHRFPSLVYTIFFLGLFIFCIWCCLFKYIHIFITLSLSDKWIDQKKKYENKNIFNNLILNKKSSLYEDLRLVVCKSGNPDLFRSHFFLLTQFKSMFTIYDK